jgi:hypothetical protein
MSAFFPDDSVRKRNCLKGVRCYLDTEYIFQLRESRKSNDF